MPYRTEMLNEKIRISPSVQVQEDSKSTSAGKANDVIVEITIHSNGEQSKSVQVSNLGIIESMLQKGELTNKEGYEGYLNKIAECQHILSQLKEVISEKIPNK